MLGLASLIVAFSVSHVVAQDTSHATCSDPDYEWSFNSLGQSPCQIGEDLGNVCTSDGSFNIQYLPAGYYYSGVGASFATNCVCNSVYYSVLNACAACQGGAVAAWDDWKSNCTVAYSTFPDSIPDDTAVPHYAYIPLLSNGTFDFATAETDNGAEATFTGSATSTSGPLTTKSSTGTASSAGASASASSSAAASSSGGGKSHTGAIVGGVIAGVVALLVVAGLIFWWLRRKRAAAAHSPGPESSFLAPNATGTTYTPTMVPAPYNHEKVYDPNDPSTFPNAMPTASPYPASGPYQGSGYSPSYNPPSSPDPLSPNRYSMSVTPQTTGQPPHSGGYHGVAEI